MKIPDLKFVNLPAGFGCEEFWMAKTPTTVAQWNEVMPHDPREGKPDWPVTRVSFEDALAFCAALKSLGLECSIPTDAQWCRAVGLEPANLEEYAVFSWSAIQPVKTKLPNEFGLYDMRGNVWEHVARRTYREGQWQYLRGCSWADAHLDARAVVRINSHLAGRYNYIGFRVVSVVRPVGLESE
jgi:formylglycine-generating enzyme required for sulfatase activity